MRFINQVEDGIVLFCLMREQQLKLFYFSIANVRVSGDQIEVNILAWHFPRNYIDVGGLEEGAQGPLLMPKGMIRAPQIGWN